jgi:hypothetical protein
MYTILLKDKIPGSLRILVSAILVFYIEKHGQTYPESLKQHDICVWVMCLCIFEKSHNLPLPYVFCGHCIAVSV